MEDEDSGEGKLTGSLMYLLIDQNWFNKVFVSE